MQSVLLFGKREGVLLLAVSMGIPLRESLHCYSVLKYVMLWESVRNSIEYLISLEKNR